MKNTSKSVMIAVGLALALVLWIVSGALGGAKEMANELVDQATQQVALRTVEVVDLTAQPVSREVIISAQTDVAREVELRAETLGRVVALGAERGTFVEEGGLIVRIEERDRAQRLSQARAVLKQRELEYQAAKGLVEKGYQSETRAAEAAAQLEIARAELENIELDQAKTEIRAPFDGFLATREVEVGDFLQPGTLVGMFIEIDPLIVTGEVTERDVLLIEKGMTGVAVLPDGTELEGTVRFVSPLSSREIRTFPVELEVPNPGGKIPAGITAKVIVPTRTVVAHRVSPAVLSLNAAGEFGVKVVNAEGVVDFYPATVVKSGPDGVWLAGLPEQVRLIVNGQGFVREGEQVEAVNRQEKS